MMSRQTLEAKDTVIILESRMIIRACYYKKQYSFYAFEIDKCMHDLTTYLVVIFNFQ